MPRRMHMDPETNQNEEAKTSDQAAAVELLMQCPASSISPTTFFSSAQWTADGTTILTGSSDHSISSFVLPADLLQPRDKVRPLQAQAVTKLPEPTQVISPAPFFSLADPSSQTFLVGCRDHPVHLHHAFPGRPDSGPIAHYKLIRHETEQYIYPTCLVWPRPGNHFLCGSANRIDYFDVSRHGSDGPVLTVPTIPSKRHLSKGHGVGMKGTVSALAISPPEVNGGSLVAAGTRTRWMGLYDLNRSDGAVANWQISESHLAGSSPDGKAGQGIVQLLWSPCGRYLVVNERRSPRLLVYDIRGSGKLLSELTCRRSESQQKLFCDVFPGVAYAGGGFEVWAGCQDGSVLVWDKVGSSAAETDSSWSWTPHNSPVCSTALHSSGSVVATCSGGWEHRAPAAQLDGKEPAWTTEWKGRSYTVLDESTLKLWSISSGVGEEEENSPTE